MILGFVQMQVEIETGRIAKFVILVDFEVMRILIQVAFLGEKQFVEAENL